MNRATALLSASIDFYITLSISRPSYTQSYPLRAVRTHAFTVLTSPLALVFIVNTVLIE